MNKTRIILLLLTLSAGLLGCSNKDKEEEAEILTRPIRTCEGLRTDNGRAYIDGDSLHISATVAAPRKIATHRLHGPTGSLAGEQSVEVYELHGFFGQEFEEDEYISDIDVQIALSNISVPNEIVIKCKQGDQTLIRIPLDKFNN